MEILGHEIPKYLIEDYIKTITIPGSLCCNESEKMREKAHNAIFEYVGITREDRKFIQAIDDLTENLIRKGYF